MAARVAARVAARATARAGAGAGNDESELSDLQSSDVELTEPLSLVPASPASPALPASPVSPALQLRPNRARKVPARYQG